MVVGLVGCVVGILVVVVVSLQSWGHILGLLCSFLSHTPSPHLPLRVVVGSIEVVVGDVVVVVCCGHRLLSDTILPSGQTYFV